MSIFRAMAMPPLKIALSTRGLMIIIAITSIILLSYIEANKFINNTNYSVNYSEERFMSLHTGMTPVQVEAILGPPLYKSTLPGEPGRVEWSYSAQIIHTKNYYRRDVVFKDNRVWYTVREYWLD
jgi:hypothetical protein